MAKNKNRTDFGATAEFRARRKKRKKGMAIWQKILLAIVFVFCAILLLAMGVVTYFKYIHKPVSDVTPPPILTPNVTPGNTDDPDNSETVEPLLKLRTDKYNFLVLGCDRRAWLSDVIMIASYDITEGSVSIMQIPRDTYVTVSNTLFFNEDGTLSVENFDGKGDYGTKINAVLAQGGTFAEKELSRIAALAKDKTGKELDAILEESFLELTRTEFENYLNATGSKKRQAEYDIRMKFGIKYLSALLSYSFGTPFDYYAQVNLDGFVSIVDAIGGVDVYVQHDMDYEDPLQDLYIHIKKGQQHLDGKAAEGFIRFRYGYAAADIARIDAQKIFMTAFIKKVLSLEGIMNLNDLVTEIGNNLNTNLPISDALYFATHALDIDLSKVVMLTMPGTPEYVDGISYYLIEKNTMIEQVNTYLNKFTEPLGEEYFLTTEIASINTSASPLTAEQITDKQPNLGFLPNGGMPVEKEPEQTEEPLPEVPDAQDPPQMPEDTVTDEPENVETPSDTPLDEQTTGDTPEDVTTEDVPTEDAPTEEVPVEDVPVETPELSEPVAEAPESGEDAGLFEEAAA